MSTSPGRRRLTASSVPIPSASPVTGTFRRISWDRTCPTGRRRSPSWTLPFGRPRWLARMTDAPALRSSVDRRDGGPDARIVGDPAVGQRDVEVDANEDPFAGDVRVADRELVHRGQAVTGRRAATNAIRSATRQL